MYEIAYKHFDIKEFYDEVKREIDDTHEFLEIKQSARLSEAANAIARVGIPLAAAALVASLFGMELVKLHVWKCWFGTASCVPNTEFWLLVSITVIAALVVFGGVHLWLIRKVKENKSA